MHSLRYTFAFLFLSAVSRAYSVSPPKPAFGPRAELFSCVFAKVPEKSWKIAAKRLKREVGASWVVANSCRLWLKQFLKSDLTSLANSSRITSHEPRVVQSCSKERRDIKTPTFVFGETSSSASSAHGLAAAKQRVSQNNKAKSDSKIDFNAQL